MVIINGPKETSFQYGKQTQLNLANKYRNRNNNRWRFRIKLAHDLVDKYALPRLRRKQPKDIVVVDVGCSIGTFAIEFTKLGYHSYGIDFDPAALKIAKQLSKEDKVSPEFICGDISSWGESFPSIDIAIAFDIFEHLHDDELGSFLQSIRRQFSKRGTLIFHTFPTQYDYIFFSSRGYLRFPLLPFRNLSIPKFDRVVKMYASLIDTVSLLTKGSTHKEHIKFEGHCNPLTKGRLTDILKRAGYDIVYMGSSQLYQSKKSVQKQFSKQPIVHRNLYGVAIPKQRI